MTVAMDVSRVDPIRSICVFGGSQHGADPGVLVAAWHLGQQIAAAGIRLVYGGGSVGLSGAVAKGAASSNGNVVAIAPNFLLEGMRHAAGLQQVIAVSDMPSRKRLMFSYADAFVALPGGLDTIGDMADVLSARNHKQHSKPLLVANLSGLWTPWLALLDHLEASGYAAGEVGSGLLVSNDVAEFLPLLRHAAQQPDDTDWVPFEVAIEEAGGYYSPPNP